MRHKAAVVLTVLASILGLLSPTAAQAVIDPPPATWTAECPPTIQCVVHPAAYIANGGNIEDYGNYDVTNRPQDMAINSVVIHDTEGTCQEADEHFDDPTSYVSSHYIICKSGLVIQKVRLKDTAWHAGNWHTNGHSVGLEHEGNAAEADYTFAQYRASAELVKYVTTKYGIPRDRGHIIGHDNVMGAPNNALSDMHTDPGPFWNWLLYMTLVNGVPSLPNGNLNSSFVTVAPTWPLSKLPVTGCSKGSQSCVSPVLQPTNFVYLRTEPRENAPMVNDPLLGQGGTEVSNNAARVFYGQTFALVEKALLGQNGVWYHIYENGIDGWFYSPWNAPTGLPVANSKVKYVTPKPGKPTVPVYARPIPEKNEYPADVVTPPSPGSFWIKAPEALPYTMKAGQKYTVIDANPPTDYFYAWSSTADSSRFPGDHTVYQGATKYYEI